MGIDGCKAGWILASSDDSLADVRFEIRRELDPVVSGAAGKRISQQLFAILDKIRTVDALMTRATQNWVREAHPEVSFAALLRMEIVA